MRVTFGLAAALMMCGGALLAGCSSSSNHCSGESVCGVGNAVNPVQATASSAHPSPSAAGKLLVAHTWPTAKECDGATSVAMETGGKPLSQFDPSQQDFRSQVATAENKGGTWGGGFLYLDLSTDGRDPVTVDNLHLTSRVPKEIGPPDWVALTQGGCGGVKDRVFDLDLDKPNLVDRGIVEDGPVDPSAPPIRTNRLGSGFTVSAADPAIIRVDVSACHGNYEWSLQIDYSYRGQYRHEVVGPFRSFAVAGSNTAVYVPNPSTGDIGMPTGQTSVPGCASQP